MTVLNEVTFTHEDRTYRLQRIAQPTGWLTSGKTIYAVVGCSSLRGHRRADVLQHLIDGFDKTTTEAHALLDAVDDYRGEHINRLARVHTQAPAQRCGGLPIRPLVATA